MMHGSMQLGRCHTNRTAFSAPRGGVAALHKRCHTEDRSFSATRLQAGSAPPPVSDVTSDIPMRLNQTPHERETRRHFYADTATSIVEGLKSGTPRLRARCIIPELNPQMDIYRVGTLLELAREIATRIAEDGRRVKVCVQGSMGEGVFSALPLSLNGVSRIMVAMDWGEVGDFISLGEVGASEVEDDASVYLLLAPQNIIGGCVLNNLGEMVEAVEAAGKQIVLLNPTLADVPSAGGMMGVRGRAERIAFDKSFTHCYHFRLLYWSGSMYPIVGALRKECNGPWQVYKRIDLGRTTEQYQLWGEFEEEPQGNQITKSLQEREPLRLRGTFPTDKPKPKSTGKWW